MNPLTYQQSGVDYEPLDAFKRLCQQAAATTRDALLRHDLTEPAAVRGESAYLVETADEFLAHVEEGLGTKNLVADVVLAKTGVSHYAAVGIDTVATIVNDLITTGARPLVIAMHAGVGDGAWFNDTRRSADLAGGFAEGCRRSRAVWGGGETPALKGIINDNAIVLAGSAFGRIRPKHDRITGRVRDGDAIVFLGSSGVHTNGLTLCRAIADRLPNGYQTDIGNGQTYGAALLEPSVIYVDFVTACQEAKVALNYAAHVTGHGWRKLMRLDEPFVHEIDNPGKLPQLFEFIMQAGPMDQREAFATFNMGVGFAVWIDPRDVSRVLELAGAAGYHAWHAGHAVKNGDRKAVEILPLNITFESETLSLR